MPGALARAEQAPFVGRAAALRRLQERWDEASRNEGGLVVCTGEPGIGKTRLVAQFAAAVHDDGAVVLHGRSDEESVTPYQPFVEALRLYAAHRPGLTEEIQLPEAGAETLASLVPELGRSCAAAPSRRCWWSPPTGTWTSTRAGRWHA